MSEKTPDNLFVFPTLLELFPDAKLIEVVRDPRAVIHSLLEVAREARRLNRPVPPSMQSLASAIPYVRLGHEVGETARKSAPHRYFVLKYEALVLQPDSVTRALCDFLGLDWSKNMLTPGEFEHATERPITSNPEWYDEKRFKRNIERTSLTRWQREMPSHRQIRITKAFENHGRLRELGYEPTLEHLPSSERALGSVVSALRKTAGDSRLYLQRLLD